MMTLDRALKVYKATYDWTNDRIMDLLGLGHSAYASRRKGQTEFTARELHILSEMLGKSMEEVYEMLPEINHRP